MDKVEAISSSTQICLLEFRLCAVCDPGERYGIGAAGTHLPSLPTKTNTKGCARGWWIEVMRKIERSMRLAVSLLCATAALSALADETAAACSSIVLSGELPPVAANRKGALGYFDMVSDSKDSLVDGRPVYSLGGGNTLFMYHSRGMWVVSESLEPGPLQLGAKSTAASPDKIRRIEGTAEGEWTAFNAAPSKMLADMGAGKSIHAPRLHVRCRATTTPAPTTTAAPTPFPVELLPVPVADLCPSVVVSGLGSDTYVADIVGTYAMNPPAPASNGAVAHASWQLAAKGKAFDLVFHGDTRQWVVVRAKSSFVGHRKVMAASNPSNLPVPYFRGGTKLGWHWLDGDVPKPAPHMTIECGKTPLAGAAPAPAPAPAPAAHRCSSLAVQLLDAHVLKGKPAGWGVHKCLGQWDRLGGLHGGRPQFGLQGVRRAVDPDMSGLTQGCTLQYSQQQKMWMFTMPQETFGAAPTQIIARGNARSPVEAAKGKWQLYDMAASQYVALPSFAVSCWKDRVRPAPSPAPVVSALGKHGCVQVELSGLPSSDLVLEGRYTRASHAKTVGDRWVYKQASGAGILEFVDGAGGSNMAGWTIRASAASKDYRVFARSRAWEPLEVKASEWMAKRKGGFAPASNVRCTCALMGAVGKLMPEGMRKKGRGSAGLTVELQPEPAQRDPAPVKPKTSPGLQPVSVSDEAKLPASPSVQLKPTRSSSLAIELRPESLVTTPPEGSLSSIEAAPGLVPRSANSKRHYKVRATSLSKAEKAGLRAAEHGHPTLRGGYQHNHNAGTTHELITFVIIVTLASVMSFLMFRAFCDGGLVYQQPEGDDDYGDEDYDREERDNLMGFKRLERATSVRAPRPIILDDGTRVVSDDALMQPRTALR